MKKNIFFFFIFSLYLILTLTSCSTTDPKLEPDLTLKLEDVSCTEAWLQLTTNNIQLPATINLLKNNSVTQTFTLSTKDSLLYINSLLPNQTYKLQVSRIQNPVSSNELSVMTMDTTSHNFTWQTFEFGEHSSSTLYDVAIIDENNIWAVGEIYMNDSLGNPDPSCYNALHWNGTNWELKKIKTNACGGVDYPPIKAIFTFTVNDILFAHIDGSISHYDGINFVNNCSLITQLNGSANKIWGVSKNDFYVVSVNGLIAHYQNGSWTMLYSGTDLNINDIWGAFNKRTQEWEILAVASNFGTSLEKEILQIKKNAVTKLPLSSQMWPLKTVWFVPDKQYYVAGDGVYQKKLLKDSLWKNKALDITTFSTYSIRGNNINDVFGVGAFGDFIHFNGLNWQTNFTGPNLNYGSYKSVQINGDIIFAVGDEYSQAVILKGIR